MNKNTRAALLFTASAGVLFAQASAQNSIAEAQSAAPAQQSQSPASASPVPSDQEILSGSIDLGWRWVTGVRGSDDTYKSVVDLTSGPKLLGTDFTILDPGRHLFDSINVRAYDWGDDPNSTLHVDIHRKKLYNFDGDYRNLAYYNNLPGYADPLLATNGIVLNEQALETRTHISDFRLELLPDHVIVPYLEYDRSSDNGNGIATFVVPDSNEYPVVNLVRDSTDNYRGGVRIERPRFHLKLEQGGTVYKDDEQLNAGSGVDYGNYFAPVFGQTLSLTSLSETYGVRGHSVYTDASFSANPVEWADFYGTFLYSEPVTNTNFLGLDTGNQILLSEILFYTGEQNLIYSAAKQPHTSGNVGAEIRPLPRLRLIPSWLTDRMHTAGSGAGQDTLMTAAGPAPIASLFNSTLVSNYNQAEMNVFVDVAKRITLRGGYRYVWGYANDGILPMSGLVGFEQGKIRQNVALAGISWHPLQNAWINLDYENGASGSTYFATSLYNYQRASARGRHQISNAFSVAAAATMLSNRNPSPGIHLEFLAHTESASLFYTPSAGKYWDFEGSYTRSTLRSDIDYLDPEFLISGISSYRDNSHTVTALFNFNLPGRRGYKTRLSLGGSAYLANGSNPTTFYQPTAKLAVAFDKNISWVTEWRYYGFAESFFFYQGFRTDTVTTGVRLTR